MREEMRGKEGEGERDEQEREGVKERQKGGSGRRKK